MKSSTEPRDGDSHMKSVLKGFSWRIVATTTTAIISYYITGEWSMALSIASIEFVGKIFLYYIHERLWQKAPIK